MDEAMAELDEQMVQFYKDNGKTFQYLSCVFQGASYEPIEAWDALLRDMQKLKRQRGASQGVRPATGTIKAEGQDLPELPLQSAATVSSQTGRSRVSSRLTEPPPSQTSMPKMKETPLTQPPAPPSVSAPIKQELQAPQLPTSQGKSYNRTRVQETRVRKKGNPYLNPPRYPAYP